MKHGPPTTSVIGERHSPRPAPSVHFTPPDFSSPSGSSNGQNRPNHVVLSIEGNLSTEVAPQIWKDILGPIRRNHPQHVEIDAAKMSCTDSSCVALLAEIQRVVAGNGGNVKISGLKSDLQALLELSTLSDPQAYQLRPPPRPGTVTRIGKWAAHAIGQLKTLVTFIGEMCGAFVWVVHHPRQVRWRDLLISCEKAGADALPVILLVGFLIGVMLAFQSAGQTERYGVRTVIPSVVAIAVTRELGPLLTTILIAGRTGSAYAAELGSMKADQELNALKVMGLDPVRFLAVPRVLAVVLMAPLLTAFFDLAGIIGGYTAMATHDFSFTRYIVQAYQSLNWSDVFGGLGKTVVFAAIIGGVGCMCGIQAGMESRAVGQSTTRAVVTAIVLIIAADGCFGVIYYYFGI